MDDRVWEPDIDVIGKGGARRDDGVHWEAGFDGEVGEGKGKR